ncbi:MAG: TIGR03620 family F420-dependent LLM class oxidoreductase [Actinomycetota bacterium]
MDRNEFRGRIGPWGVDTFRPSFLSPADSAELASGLDEQGWPVLWIPEIGLTEALSQAGHLLAGSERILVASAIARIGDRTPGNAAAAHAYLRGAYDGRHVLGLGLGPLARQPGPMRVLLDWLDEFDAADEAFGGEATTLLAAYGPRMVRLGGERSLGAMTFLVTPEHTAASRELLGADPVLVAEQAVVLTEDRAEARSIARAHTTPYVASAPHERKFAALGFGPADWSGGHSDRLLDALVASGTMDECVERLREHLDAGADHVACCVLGTETVDDELSAYAELADALGVGSPS